MALEAELVTYERMKPWLLQAEGRWAVIRGDDFLGTYPDYEAALEAGYRAFGLGGFLVRQIERVETVLWL
jgi:hypothetical protein